MPHRARSNPLRKRTATGSTRHSPGFGIAATIMRRDAGDADRLPRKRGFQLPLRARRTR